MTEVLEVLRAWLDGAGLRTAAARAGVERKTARRYVHSAVTVGLDRTGGSDQLTDELIGQVLGLVRPERPGGYGPSWQALQARHGRLVAWVKGVDPDGIGPPGRPLTATKITELLAREGCVVPYRTVHRYLSQKCGYRVKPATVRVADGPPGGELQLDFGYMGLIADSHTGRNRKVYGLIATAVYSRHMFVYFTHRQTLATVIEGLEAAWQFFGGVFKVVIPDNLSPVVNQADPTDPVFTAGWLDYVQHCGFATDPARVRHPRDKPKVERSVSYVKRSLWDGERFTSLAQARAKAVEWCSTGAGMRIHGTTQARPLEVFNSEEKPVLLPLPPTYDRPVWVNVKVHPDLHVQVCKSLYSVPVSLAGMRLTVRADSRLVRLYHRGVLVKTHPRVDPGQRHTDLADVPEDKVAYATRSTDWMKKKADQAGEVIGVYMTRLLDVPLPWTAMRSGYRLLGLVDRYGVEPVTRACQMALDLDVISVGKIQGIVERGLERQPVADVVKTTQGGRFARPANQFRRHPVGLILVDGDQLEINQEAS